MEYCTYQKTALRALRLMAGKRGIMRQVQVLINEPEKAERLCHILSGHSGPFDLAKGSYTVDGKSILGICTMDLSAPLTLTIYGEEEDGVIEEIREFVV